MHTGDEYSFLNAPLRNFLNAIFSHAISHPRTDKKGSGDLRVLGLGGLRRSFARSTAEKRNRKGHKGRAKFAKRILWQKQSFSLCPLRILCDLRGQIS